jgi:hypothetical protein
MPALSVWFIRASLAYLVAGFALGAAMLALKASARYGAMARALVPHVELVLVGWTMQLTMGVAFWILPRFEGGASRGAVGYAWGAFVLLNAGVLLVAASSVGAGSDVARAAGRLAELLAAAAFGLHAWGRIKGASAAP